MDDSDMKMEDCKKEIRSILIPYQKGCFLPEFIKTYREFMGKGLPAREFGYRNDIEFLYSMPDVVRVTSTRAGDYHLLGIADEKTKHIQKMVVRQKPAKLKVPPPRSFRPSRTFTLPPRFSEARRAPEPKLYLTPSRKETLPSVPAPREFLLATPSHRDTHSSAVSAPRECLLPTPSRKEPLLANSTLSITVQNDNIQSEPQIGPMQQVISLVQSFKDRLAADDLLVEYKRKYNKNLSLSMYGFSSIEECIENIPVLKIVQRNNVNFVVHQDNLPNTSNNQVDSTNVWDSDPPADRIPTPEVPSTLNSECIENEDCDNRNVPNYVITNFKKVAERFYNGIWASDFLSFYEEVTSEPLDIHDLGYSCLSDLIDDVPDIFVRQPVAGSRKDYVIYPAGDMKSVENDTDEGSTASLHLVGSALVNHIVLNLKRILEAYSEGILLENVLDIYSINCKDFLHVEDLGFNNLETFLLSIKSRVPLRFDVINGKKSIHLLKLCDTTIDLYDTAPEVCENEAIPFDAVFPDFQLKPITLPDDFDYSIFVPVFTSAVAGPDAVYIHLQDERTEDYKQLSRDLDSFYDGSQSEIYMMKSVHIKPGASCVAKWPTDSHWYRAQILSIPSMEKVKVYYNDFGTKDIIPKFLLRYIKKEFIDLPAQVIKCRLACVKPPNNAEKWDTRAGNRILNLCEDVQLMGKFTEIESDGFHDIILCDTNGDEDIYINDLLIKEGLAEFDSGQDNSQAVAPCISSSPVQSERVQINYPLLNPFQALQAQYFLKCFAAVAPSFAQNENYINLLQQVTTHCHNVDPMQTNIGMPFATPVVPPGFNTFMPNTFANPNAFYNSYSGGAVGGTLGGSPAKSSKAVSSLNKMDHSIKSPNDRALTLPKPTEISGGNVGEYDDDIFDDDDDDDEIFQQFCQKVSSAKTQHIKRVMLSDGYKVHIIVVDSEPYASSGDISHLIWNNKEADYLLRRLQVKEVDIPGVSLSEDGNEELFQQLESYNVKGVQKTTGFKSSILLYPLRNVIKILNVFGHPSITLRMRLTEEIANFDPTDQHWQDASPEVSDSTDDEVFSGVTDDDKIERLCLFDLLAMKESINVKRKKMMAGPLTDSDISIRSAEIHKLELLYKKVLRRIQEINEICKQFE